MKLGAPIYDDYGNLIGDTAALVDYPPDSIPGSLPETASQPSGWLTSLTDALPKVAAFMTAEQLAQVNISRARSGLPPLNTAAYGPQVGVNLAPATQKMLMYGAIGVGAILILPRLLKRRRR